MSILLEKHFRINRHETTRNIMTLKNTKNDYGHEKNTKRYIGHETTRKDFRVFSCGLKTFVLFSVN
jgi:hypothetical protein